MHRCGNASGVLGKRLTAHQISQSPWPLVPKRFAHDSHDGFDRLSNVFIPPPKSVIFPEGTGNWLTVTPPYISDNPIDKKAANEANSLLIRAGYLRKAQAGFFHTLPLGLRVQSKLEKLIDKYMRPLNANKVSLSSVTGENLWRKSGRLTKHNELLKITGKYAVANMLLAPTHEEEITDIVKQSVHSYKQLPLRLYQIGRKYRDERRVRQGMLRAREFLMKDLYTFDVTEEAALETYTAVKAAYQDFFDELSIPYTVAEAASGSMGGNLSHEFHFRSEDGEDTLILCDKCSYVANEELAERAPPSAYSQDHHEITVDEIESTAYISKDTFTLVEVYHPTTLNLPQQPKPQINPYALGRVVPDLDFSHSNAFEVWKRAQVKYEREQRVLPNGKFQLLRIFDRSLLNDAGNLTAAARAALPEAASLQVLEPKTRILDMHKDPVTEETFDLLRIVPGDTCPRCLSGHLATDTAIEVAHTFHLGTRYTQPFNVEIQIPQQQNTRTLLQMGCHGIGVSRLIAAAASVLKDERGLNWPRAIAPWEVAILPWAMAGTSGADAPSIASLLANAGLDVLLDDRRHDGPAKIADADLVGYPVLVVLGRKWVESRHCQIQCRRLGVKEDVPEDKIVEFVTGLLNRL